MERKKVGGGKKSRVQREDENGKKLERKKTQTRGERWCLATMQRKNENGRKERKGCKFSIWHKRNKKEKDDEKKKEGNGELKIDERKEMLEHFLCNKIMFRLDIVIGQI